MERMKRFALNLLLLVGAIFLGSLAHAETREPVLKVGAIISLSGDLEQYGNEINEGFKLATEESSPVKVEMLVEDDRSADKVTTLAAAKKLINVDGADVLIEWTVASSPPLVPVVTAARTPLIVGAYDSRVAHSGPYVFGTEVNYLILAPEIADFMTKRLGVKRIAIISANDYWSQNYPPLIRERAQANGAQIVLDEAVDPDSKDLRSLIARAKSSGADAIFAPLYGDSLYALVRQARELHFAGILEGADGIFEEDVRALGAETEGIYAAQTWVDNSEFRALVQNKFSTSKSALQLGMVACGYDIIKHLRAIAEEIDKRQETISSASMLQGIKSFHSKGVLGPMFLGAPPEEAGEEMVVVHKGAFELAK